MPLPQVPLVGNLAYQLNQDLANERQPLPATTIRTDLPAAPAATEPAPSPAGSALVAALRTPKYGAERYIEEALNKAGGRMLNGRRSKPQFAYQTGPLKGMTQAQASEHLRAQYAALPDAERMRYEDQANRNDITSPRERDTEQQHFNALAMDRGLGASPMAAPSGGAQGPASMPGSRPGSGFSGVAGGGKADAFRLRTPEEVAGRIGAPAPMSRPRLEPGGMTTDMARGYAANVNPDGTLRRPKPVLTPDRIQVPRAGAGMQSTLDTTAPPPAVPGSTPSMESAGPGQPRLKPPVIRDKPLSAAPVLGGGIRASSPASQSLSRSFDPAPALPAARTKIAAALPPGRMTGLAKLLA